MTTSFTWIIQRLRPPTKWIRACREYYKKETFLQVLFTVFPSLEPSGYSSSLCESCLRDLTLSRLACARRASSMAFVSFWLQKWCSAATMYDMTLLTSLLLVLDTALGIFCGWVACLLISINSRSDYRDWTSTDLRLQFVVFVRS